MQPGEGMGVPEAAVRHGGSVVAWVTVSMG